MEADLKRARTAQKNLDKELETAKKAETELKTQTMELEAKLQYQMESGKEGKRGRDRAKNSDDESRFEAQRNTKLLARLRASEITSDMEGVYPQLAQSTPDMADERDILIAKLKGLVSELQTQLGNTTQREKERSGDMAEDARRTKYDFFKILFYFKSDPRAFLFSKYFLSNNLII
jgi:hypothetical protein